MPQLDQTLLFNQIFWLFIIFTNLYIIFICYLLPSLLKIFKVRKQVSVKIFEECQILDKHLQQVTFFYKKSILSCIQIRQILFSMEKFFQNYGKYTLKSKLIPKTLIYFISTRILYTQILKKN